MHATLLLLAASALALTACAAGPDYNAPAVPELAKSAFAAHADGTTPVQAEGDDWWRLYDDQTLDGLVQQALSANTDIRIAAARLEKARAELGGARSEELPQTETAASVTRQRYPQWQVLPGGPREFSSVDLGLNVAYELDLFGRVRRGVQAAKGDAVAAQADLDAARVGVAAETTRAYLDAKSAGEQVAAARDAVDLLDKSIEVTKARVEAGRSQNLDVFRLQSLRDQRYATLPPLEARRQSARFRLAVLLGRAPADLPAGLSDDPPLPALAKPIPVGDGAGLLARRPDVRAAEGRLAAATARIGLAKADYFPRVTFSGSGGYTSDSTSDPLAASSGRYAFGPQIQWAFPNFSGVAARVRATRADEKAALAQFDKTVLTALQETETALTAYGKTVEERQALVRARDEAQRAADVADRRHQEGSVDFLTLYDAERSLVDAKAALADADGRVADRQVDLFKALGGGWQSAGRPLARN